MNRQERQNPNYPLAYKTPKPRMHAAANDNNAPGKRHNLNLIGASVLFTMFAFAFYLVV